MSPHVDVVSTQREAPAAELCSTPASTMNAPQGSRLAGKRVGMVVFSHYPADPRPRRAAEALIQEGASVDLICEWDEKSPKRERQDNLTITRIPIRHFRGGVLNYAYQYFAFIVWSSLLFARRMLRRRYDLIHVHNMPDVLVASAILPSLFGAKVILDQHDPMPELMMTIFGKNEKSLSVRVIRLLEKWSLRRAHLVITVNEACRRIFSERSCPFDKVAVIMNCPDAALFPFRPACSYPLRATDARFVIMYHGSLVERNGLDLAVDAMARLVPKVPNAELRVFGRSTPYLERVMQKVRELGLENHVCYLGSRKLELLAGEIEKCDLGVIPNQRNTFTDINTPTRIFEYLALGKPVIAPRTAGICDYFGPESLFFFESGNSTDLAKCMESAAKHPAEARDAARKGQEIYLRHTWAKEREELVNLVAGLMGRAIPV